LDDLEPFGSKVGDGDTRVRFGLRNEPDCGLDAEHLGRLPAVLHVVTGRVLIVENGQLADRKLRHRHHVLSLLPLLAPTLPLFDYLFVPAFRFIGTEDAEVNGLPVDVDSGLARGLVKPVLWNATRWH